MSFFMQSDFDRWKREINEAGSKAQSLAGSTEGEFLKAGSDLQDFYSRSDDISSSSNTAAALTSGDEIQSIISGLQTTLDTMTSFMSELEVESGNSGESLRGYIKLLGNILVLMGNFRKTVNILEIIGISTRIESSYLGQDDAGFKSLAADIKKLARVVDSKSENIIEESEGLIMQVKGTLSRLIELQIKQKDQSQIIINNARNSLAALERLHESSSETAKILSEKSGQVSESIGEVVVSLQLHDIVRQQMEHVKEALDVITDKLADEPVIDEEDEDEDELPESVKEIISFMADIGELQQAQLRNSRNEFNSAVQNIIKHLRQVASNVAGMSAEATKMAGTANRAGSSFLNDIEDYVSSIIDLLKENARLDHELSDAMLRVADKVGELSGFVGDIDQINSEIELIALNARVRAAHTGSKGAPLGVLSEGLQKLSIESHTRTGLISDILQNVVGIARQLCDRINESVVEKDERTNQLVLGLGELLGPLREINEKIFAILNKLDEEGRALATDIERTVSGITVDKIVTDQVDEIIEKINLVIKEARGIVPESAVRKAVNLQILSEKYTMGKERDIHNSLLAPSPYSTPGEEDLYGSGYEDEIGDNIELF
ncbi:MAG: methyl-accepting chemotaxis protein [Firmicutes bacterium]|nr:methyl-accepting chemotaxis protein [Bacillota bacterium]